jgi:hypothetical protein
MLNKNVYIILLDDNNTDNNNNNNNNNTSYCRVDYLFYYYWVAHKLTHFCVKFNCYYSLQSNISHFFSLHEIEL